MKRQLRLSQASSLLLALILSAGLLAVPAAASGCEHLVTGTRTEMTSCLKPGATVTTCLDYGEELSRVYDQAPLGSHLYQSTVTRAATTEQEGEATYTCVRCGDTHTESIPRLETPAKGDESEHANNVPPSQTGSDGEPMPAGGSSGNGSGSQRSADAQDPAENLTDESQGAARDPQEACRHVWNSISHADPATCTEPARYYHACELCGLEEVDFTTPALGHKYTSEITREATVDHAGERTYTCIRCGDAYTESIPKLPAAEAALKTGNRDSGSLDMEKLSQQEIESLLAENSLALPDEIFNVKPSVTSPFSTGKVKTSALQAAADRLNALRRIAGLPAVTLDLSLCENAQYGAVIQAANNGLSHSPSRPAGMDDAFYKQAKSAAGSSNLHSGRTLTGAVDGFMDDSGSSNISSVGHRRWQLNPTMGKVGFGYAQGVRGGGYVAEKVFDRSGAGCDYDFIAWPASGNFPAQLFDGDIAWSVTLNPAEYQIPSKSAITVSPENTSPKARKDQIPSKSAITVSLTRDSDGKTWSFSACGSNGYFNVDTSNYGVSNCIIFRPDGIDEYDDTYTVRITGLRAKNGQSVADFTYEVDFFGCEAGVSPSVAETEQQNEQNPSQSAASQSGMQSGITSGAATFRDVPTTHWASSAIESAVNQGFVNGYADGTFRPTNPVTNAHFNAMLSRAFYPTDLNTADLGSSWWSPNVAVNNAHGILSGTDLKQAELAEGVWGTEINAPINRYDMAQMMYNILLAKEAPLPSAAECQAVKGQMGDWNRIPARYQEAVTACYAFGLLNGQKDGTFGGNNNMNRAQGCTVIFRLLDYIG